MTIIKDIIVWIKASLYGLLAFVILLLFAAGVLIYYSVITISILTLSIGKTLKRIVFKAS